MWEDIEALEWERMVHPDNLEFFDIYISKGEGRAWRRFCSLLASSRALRYFKATPQLFSPTWITDIHWASITTVQIADLMETQKVVEMLRQAPSLQRCILDVVGPLLRDFPAYSTPIEVRSLEELRIRAVRPRFLDFVVLPSLINLSIGIPCYAGTDSYSYGGWDRDGVWSPIEILGERSKWKLSTFRIAYVGIKDDLDIGPYAPSPVFEHLTSFHHGGGVSCETVNALAFQISRPIETDASACRAVSGHMHRT